MNVFLISSGLLVKVEEVMVGKKPLGLGDMLLPVEKILPMLVDRSNKLTRGPLFNFVIVNWFMFLRANVVFLTQTLSTVADIGHQGRWGRW